MADATGDRCGFGRVVATAAFRAVAFDQALTLVVAHLARGELGATGEFAKLHGVCLRLCPCR